MQVSGRPTTFWYSRFLNVCHLYKISVLLAIIKTSTQVFIIFFYSSNAATAITPAHCSVCECYRAENVSQPLQAFGHDHRLFTLVYTFLQRVSIACYAERCISHSKSVRPSVCLSVCLSVCPSHTGTESKRLKLRSWGLHWRIAP